MLNIGYPSIYSILNIICVAYFAKDVKTGLVMADWFFVME